MANVYDWMSDKAKEDAKAGHFPIGKDINMWLIGGVLLGLAFLVGWVLIAIDNRDSADSVPTIETQSVSESDSDMTTRKYVISEAVTGYTRLALEYGIKIDANAFNEMLFEMGFGEGEDLFSMQVAGWLSSPEDWANAFKQDFLDEGQSPMEAMQKWADMVQAFKDSGRYQGQ